MSSTWIREKIWPGLMMRRARPDRTLAKGPRPGAVDARQSKNRQRQNPVRLSALATGFSAATRACPACRRGGPEACLHPPSAPPLIAVDAGG